MDDDPVLRSMGEDLERDDPRLAELLSGRPRHHHSAAWWLLAVPVVLAILLLPLRTTLGLLALLLIISSPLVVLWATAPPEGPSPGPPLLH
jgi:hypothetical protein